MRYDLATVTLAEYGEDLTDPATACRWVASTRGRHQGELTPGAYVALVCQSAGRTTKAANCSAEGPVIDGRLVAVGHGVLKPSLMAARLPEWEAWFNRATGRPVGSDRHPWGGCLAAGFAAFLSGVRPDEVAGWDPAWMRARPLTDRLLRSVKRIARARLRSGGWRLTRAAAEVLGRLSPEAQHAVVSVTRPTGECARCDRPIRGVTAPGGRTEAEHGPMRPEDSEWNAPGAWPCAYAHPAPSIRPSDLRWDLAAPLIRQIAASPRVRAASAKGTRRDDLLEALDGPLCPSYPRLALDLQSRIVLGERPVDLAPGLTSAEAHRWASDGGLVTPAEWLAAALGLRGLPLLRDVTVVRWLGEVQRRGAWGQLTRERVAHGPAGRTATYRLLDRIDELMVDDLAAVAGSRDIPAMLRVRPEDAFMACAERVGRIDPTDPTSHRVLAAPPPLRRLRFFRRFVSALVTPAALQREGDEMAHCVGGYVSAVEQGQVSILALRTAAGRSTAEIQRRPDGRWSILQHRAERNGAPPHVNDRLLRRVLEA